jgi:hypothetical protein
VHHRNDSGGRKAQVFYHRRIVETSRSQLVATEILPDQDVRELHEYRGLLFDRDMGRGTKALSPLERIECTINTAAQHFCGFRE